MFLGNSPDNILLYEINCLSTIWSSMRPTGVTPPWFNFVWSKFRIPKFAFTAWLIIQEKLLTRDRMVFFHMRTCTRCVLCNVADETHAHLFCDCTFARNVLSAWLIPISTAWADFQVGRIVGNPSADSLKKEMTYLYVSAAWYAIWSERNRRIHTSDNPHTVGNLVLGAKRAVREKLATNVTFKNRLRRDPLLVSFLY
ncbi:hypothetical protein DCAR_0623364 [Daucus carota subsp. sativus]|uniref:Reverse transcriptase zinc-binding domain-containing protein n=1 Tax=Daucus carota subsp. sativus TaxID=79200 RepID=A0AAF0XBI3_DAUCS|nr:hypothetical protein DCAR_0623364 [Daucus carota subsp. sativus]